MSHIDETENTQPFLSNRSYDALKWVALYALPALGTLYFALSQIWGLPRGEEVVGTVVALDAFLGVVLGLSNRSYNHSEAKYDGSLVVDTDDDRDLYSFEVNVPLESLRTKKELTIKVENPY